MKTHRVFWVLVLLLSSGVLSLETALEQEGWEEAAGYEGRGGRGGRCTQCPTSRSRVVNFVCYCKAQKVQPWPK